LVNFVIGVERSRETSRDHRGAAQMTRRQARRDHIDPSGIAAFHRPQQCQSRSAGIRILGSWIHCKCTFQTSRGPAPQLDNPVQIKIRLPADQNNHTQQNTFSQYPFSILGARDQATTKHRQ
jgi:hypothetical protein